jgi:hypothetical protein
MAAMQTALEHTFGGWLFCRHFGCCQPRSKAAVEGTGFLSLDDPPTRTADVDNRTVRWGDDQVHHASSNGMIDPGSLRGNFSSGKLPPQQMETGMIAGGALSRAAALTAAANGKPADDDGYYE